MCLCVRRSCAQSAFDLSLACPLPEAPQSAWIDPEMRLGWTLQLGDIRGAFLEAGALDRKHKLLYSSLLPGRIPGVPDGAVILFLGNIHGLNDAPQRWWKKFDAVMTSIDFVRSTFDMCVYALRGTVGNLEGTMCVHVDDTICGGPGYLFSKTLTTLRHRFPFRKWQVEEGMFCDSKYVQNKDTKEIMIPKPSLQ